jgi:hypothetical protein
LALRERVLAEAERFRAVLPALLPTYGERWVVFRDGEVASAHATEEEAYVAGLERFGPYGGHVVAVVRQAEVVMLGAITALGL